MKKLFSLLLVAMILFNTGGYYFVFTYNQYTLRREIQGLIRARYFEESCITLQLKTPLLNPDFKWINKGEFRYKGVLYDVISERTVGNVTTFRCINDKQEEKLLSGLHHSHEFAIGQNNPARSRHASAMLYHVIKLALTENCLNQPPLSSTEILLNNPSHPLSIISHPPASPPPESV